MNDFAAPVKMDQTHEWRAQMITAAYQDAGATLLRTQFSLDTGHGDVTEAILRLTAQGVVEAWVNGTPASADLLTPGWSAFEWRLRYATYDVTSLLSAKTVLGLHLGKGWYGGRLGWAEEGQSWYGNDVGALAELDVVELRLRGSPTRFCQHRRCHVDTQHVT